MMRQKQVARSSREAKVVGIKEVTKPQQLAIVKGGGRFEQNQQHLFPVISVIKLLSICHTLHVPYQLLGRKQDTEQICHGMSILEHNIKYQIANTTSFLCSPSQLRLCSVKETKQGFCLIRYCMVYVVRWSNCVDISIYLIVFNFFNIDCGLYFTFFSFLELVDFILTSAIIVPCWCKIHCLGYFSAARDYADSLRSLASL